MRRNNSLWKTTVVSLSAMMTVSMGAAVWAASTEKTTQESQSDQVTEENSETKADTKDTENQTSEPQSAEDVSDSSQNQTEECKITLSDDGILVDGEAISTDSESAVYAGADIVYYKEGQDSTYGAGNEDDGHSEEEAAEHTVVTITKAGTYRVSGTLSKGQIAIDLGEDSRDDESAVVNLFWTMLISLAQLHLESSFIMHMNVEVMIQKLRQRMSIRRMQEFILSWQMTARIQ